jgi:glycosyltransferase involved in cell wall biosynthesis
MSRGVPVLASDVDGNRSIVLDGEDGFLYGSESEFLRKAERLMDDPALRTALGDRARAKIAARHRPGDEIEGYLALYRELIGRRGEGGWI